MRIALSGSSGLVGQALTQRLLQQGHTVVRLLREGHTPPKGTPHPHEQWVYLNWQAPNAAALAALEGVEAVVHLMGEPIVGRWTAEKKQALETSRVGSTRYLAEVLSALEQPPQVLVCASAIGFYPVNQPQALTEASPAGEGYLAQLCQRWEAASDLATSAGIRVAHARFGIILSPRGGALKAMLPPFALGLGGPIGNGKQWFSWVHVADVVAALEHAILTPTLQGPFNVVAPWPVTNAQFTKALGRVLLRPTLLPVPPLALKALLGPEAAQALMLDGQKVEPRVLQASGFHFAHPEVEPALHHLLRC
jgi:uncharacterized protein (TIGR01777 family)